MMRATKAQATSVPATQRGWLERPGCRLYYEVTGSGPAMVLAHGLGSNHLTWWQQVPHFCDRFTCVTFAHRGYPPGSAIGIPDPQEFAGDLAALVAHLQLSDLRLVAQSMGGWTCVEYMLANPHHEVRALVLASTCGSIRRSALVDPQRLAAWGEQAAAARADMARRGISPPAGERMAREQPMLHFLYREMASAAFDREELRKRMAAMATRAPEVLRGLPVLLVTGGEDTTYPPFVSEALAAVLPNARIAQVADAGHSVYFERPERFNRLVDDFLAGTG
jgi:pimeloyl-ACP methyl ester carboxylesterase